MGTARRADQTPPANPSEDPGNAALTLLGAQAASRSRVEPTPLRDRGEAALPRRSGDAERAPTPPWVHGLLAPGARRQPHPALHELARRRRRAQGPGGR